jgi:hypothetical protein
VVQIKTKVATAIEVICFITDVIFSGKLKIISLNRSLQVNVGGKLLLHITLVINGTCLK